MLDKEIFFELKWLMTRSELSNSAKRGGMTYQRPRSGRIDHLHSRASGIQLGLRALQSEEMTGWLSGLDLDLFKVNQSNEKLDMSHLPDIGLHYKEFVCQPLSTTVHTALEFMNRHSSRRPVIFKNDFWYFKNIIDTHIDSLEQMHSNDLLIMSLPYFENFTYHHDMDQILKHCCENGIPVMLDLIWMPLINNVKKLEHTDCVELVSHSMTKVLPLSGIKGGFCLHRRPVPEHYDLYPLGNKVGYHVSLQYLHDKGYWHVRDSVKPLQKKWCGILDLPVHDMVMIAEIPKGHFLEGQSLHEQRIPDSKLLNLIPFYENDELITRYMRDKGYLT